MTKLKIVYLAFALAAGSTPAVVAAPLTVAKAEKKGKKKKEPKKKGDGAFSSCAALSSKAACDAHAKEHSCVWDAIAAGGSCGDGAPR